MYSVSRKLKVTPNYVATWYPYEGDYLNCLPQKNTSKGQLSKKAISRLRERLSYMCYIAKNKKLTHVIGMANSMYKLVMITLTLSSKQVHSDSELKSKLLQPFLRILRNKFEVVNYVWKAEVQDNSNIHFHVTIDKFIPWKSVREVWNTLQESLGYISRSKIADPNSTDIHAVYKCSNPSKYLTNYMGKKDYHKKVNQLYIKVESARVKKESSTLCNLSDDYFLNLKRKVEGKIYDCNTELKKIKAVWESSWEVDVEIEDLEKSNFSFREPTRKIVFIKSLTSRSAHLKFILDFFIVRSYKGEDFARAYFDKEELRRRTAAGIKVVTPC